MKSIKNISIVTVFVCMLFGGIGAAVADDITVTVDSLVNVYGNGAMEVCGSAVHKDGLRPLLVTVRHDESYYTTLTAPNNKWCVVVKRWTYDGKVEAGATTFK
ncbi:MAG: hypothetical protein AABZ06_00345 [Bdellovibrionota bacterium]